MIDGYLRLFDAGGKAVQGESTDHTFGKSIQIYEFSLCPSASDADVSLVDIGDDARTSFAVDLHDKWKKWQDHAKKLEDRKSDQEKAGQKQQQEMAKRLQQRSLSSLDLVTKTVAEKAADAAAKKKKEDREDGRLSFKISKDCDSASADLFQAYCSTVFQPNPKPEYHDLGKFKKAEVSLRKMFDVASTVTAPLPYLVVTFTDVAIDSYNLSYNTGRFHLTETVVFKFVGYRMQYTPQAATGDTANTGLIKAGKLTQKAAS